MAVPTYRLTLHKTYYLMGFFNLGVEVDRFVQAASGRAVLICGESRERFDVQVNRDANPNGTPRIMGGIEVRNWIQQHFKQGQVVEVRILAPDQFWLVGS